MKHSESIVKISAAIVAAQAEMSDAPKQSKNPFFSSTYADLSSILQSVRPALAKHNLSVVQLPGFEDGVTTVETVLIHSSGEWISGIAGAPTPGRYGKDGKQLAPDAQAVGSAITYLRRYSLAAVAGITQVDDDGNAASAKSKPATKSIPASTAKKRAKDMCSEAQRHKLGELLNGDAEAFEVACLDVLGKQCSKSSDLLHSEADQLIKHLQAKR